MSDDPTQSGGPTRRSLLGAGAASLGILAMPLPVAADAFSGTFPPSPAGTNYTLTGGTPFASYPNVGPGANGVGVAWSTTSPGNYEGGEKHTFNYTIYRGGQLFAYGTCIGSHGFRGGTFVSGTTPNGSGGLTGYYVYSGDFNNPSFSFYLVNVAGVRWRLVNYAGGAQNWETY